MLETNNQERFQCFQRMRNLPQCGQPAATKKRWVSGFGGILYSTQEDNDGEWSATEPLQSTSDPHSRNFFPPGAPLAAVRRNDHQSDVFAIGADGQLYTIFRLDNSSWSPPVLLSHHGIGEFMPSGSVSAISVREQTDPPTAAQARQNEVDVFAISQATGQVFISREVNHGPFTEPAPINPAQAQLDRAAHLATVKRNEQQQDFVCSRPARPLADIVQQQWRWRIVVGFYSFIRRCDDADPRFAPRGRSRTGR